MKNKMSRSLSVFVASFFIALLIVQHASAHHGWRWATDEEFELTGTITQVHLGNPHGRLMLDANGKSWRIEVGQPWRNARAGLDDELLSEGREVTIHGHRSAKEGELLMKAERVIINGTSYNLYPDRESD